MIVILAAGIPAFAAVVTIILWGHVFAPTEDEIYDYTGETQPKER